MSDDNYIARESKEFLDNFFSDELSEELMIELDERMKDPRFKSYYQERLNAQFDKPIAKTLVDYLPMLVLLVLAVIGIYLFTKSN